MAFSIAFTFPSDTRYLAVLRQFVVAASKLAGSKKFPRRHVVPCTLALIEAIDNAIFHANRSFKDLPISVLMTMDDRRVVMDVIDKGKGLGRHKRKLVDSLSPNGRGLFLIHRLMTKVESRLVTEGHRLRMILEI